MLLALGHLRCHLRSARGADAGADAALRAAVKPAVERVLREAPWTFNKTNPLKDACRAFLDAVADPGVAAPELARAATRALTLACASGKAAVCEPALGAARELVARGALAGTTQTWSPDMSQSRVKALAAAAALAASDDPPPGEPGSRGDAFDVSGSSEGNRTSRANDAARRTALVVAAAKCAETNEPRVHVAVIAASLAFATSDSFRLAGDALARVVRALLHVSVAAASREDRAAAKSALATLINAVFRRAEPHFSETTDDDSLSDPPDDSLSDPPDDSLSDPPDDSLSDPPDSGTTNSSPDSSPSSPLRLASEASDALLCVLVLCKIASGPVESGGAASAEAYRARSKTAATDLLRQLLEGPSASAWLVTFRDFARGPLCAALLRAADEDPSRAFLSSSASASSRLSPAARSASAALPARWRARRSGRW